MEKSMGFLTKTDDNLAPLIARVTLGLVMLPHGLQKTLGWFGGPGLEGWIGYTGTIGIPAPLAVVIALTESVGALALIVGIFGRVAAGLVAAVMVGAVAMVHARVGFFMNWTGAQPGEGFEYHLLALGLALIVIVLGSGRARVERRLLQAQVSP